MNDLQGYYKPLFDTLYGRYAAHVGLSRRALREALGAAAFPSALHRWDPGARAMAQEVLSLCLPVMEALSPAPDSGWLPYIYAYLADRMFPDARFAPPAQPETQALEFFLTVFTWLLAREQGHCPFDPLTDLYMLTPEEEAESPIREEYAAFRAAVRDVRFVALLRIGREIMPFDPASHTIGVHNVAVHTARMAAKAGLPVDVALVSAAALSHDAGKFGCRGKDARRIPYLHYYYTWDWLTRGGMPAIAHIAANHSTWDLEFENLQLESLLLIYADFRVRGVRDAEGREHVSIYSLSEAYGVIFGKLADMTEEKSRRYRTVYAKLRDFERFLLSCGVPSELSEDAQHSLTVLRRAKDYLDAKPELSAELSAAQRRKRAQLQSKPVYRYVALAIFVLGVAAAAYGLYSVFSHTGSYGVYFALFGFAAIFLFSSYNMLPTAHNNNNAIMKRADKAEAAMAEYVKHYPHGAFPVASWYAHPIVLKRMMDAIEEGNAVTVPEALDAVKARLKSLNADVQVEQEEYDEVVVIKAMFLNHDYQ